MDTIIKVLNIPKRYAKYVILLTFDVSIIMGTLYAKDFLNYQIDIRIEEKHLPRILPIVQRLEKAVYRLEALHFQGQINGRSR